MPSSSSNENAPHTPSTMIGVVSLVVMAFGRSGPVVPMFHHAPLLLLLLALLFFLLLWVFLFGGFYF
jgi:hypothetical protein